jgi:hypothetical protein
MNYLKAIKITAGFTSFMGFFIMMGSIGQIDYMTKIGSCSSTSEPLFQMMFGLVLIAFGFLVCKNCDPELDDDWEDWDDEIYED